MIHFSMRKRAVERLKRMNEREKQLQVSFFCTQIQILLNLIFSIKLGYPLKISISLPKQI